LAPHRRQPVTGDAGGTTKKPAQEKSKYDAS
jgi:hypothetical protein